MAMARHWNGIWNVLFLIEQKTAQPTDLYFNRLYSVQNKQD